GDAFLAREAAPRRRQCTQHVALRKRLRETRGRVFSPHEQVKNRRGAPRARLIKLAPKRLMLSTLLLRGELTIPLGLGHPAGISCTRHIVLDELLALTFAGHFTYVSG